LPLAIEASTDGTTWKKLLECDKSLDFWEVKIPEGLRARYVRVGRGGASGHYFNVSNILIYGNP
jgi:hypothetical protein